MYEACPSCADARAQGDFDAAKRCHACDGTGIVRDPKSFQCNRCGGSLAGDTEPGTREQYGLVETTVRGGYSSPHLHDCTTYCFSICEKCLRELFEAFKLPPKVSGYSAGTGEPDGSSDAYADDERAYRYRRWKKGSGHLEKLRAGICNAIMNCERPATFRKFCSGFLTDDCSCDEHVALHTYANTWTVPIDEIGCSIIDGNDPKTIDDKRRVALVWLRASSRGDDVITYHRHAPDCVQHLLDDAIDGNVTSMLWVPEKLYARRDIADEMGRTMRGAIRKLVEFKDWHLLLGDLEDFKAAVKLGYVIPAKILPNLPERDEE